MGKAKQNREAASALDTSHLQLVGPLDIPHEQPAADCVEAPKVKDGYTPLAREKFIDPPFVGYIALHKAWGSHEGIVVEKLRSRKGSKGKPNTYRLHLSPSAIDAALHLTDFARETITKAESGVLRNPPKTAGPGRNIMYLELGYNGGFLECRLKVIATNSRNPTALPIKQLHVINNPIGHDRTCSTYINKEIIAFLAIMDQLKKLF